MMRNLRLTYLVMILLGLSLVVAQAQESVFRMATFEPNSLDPAVGGPGYQEYVNLYEPLVDAYSKDGVIHPLAAESFEVSEDGLVYTFVLRPNLYWSDGEPLTAAHFRDGWLRMLDPATAAYAPQNLYPIKNAEAFNRGEITDPAEVGIEVLDARTLRVTLERPTPFFLRSVGYQAFYPIRLDVIARHGDRWMEAGNFVGNGPYMLAEWLHDQRMVFVRNPYYSGPWQETRHVDRIEYRLMQDPWSMAVPAYEAGEIDVAIVPAGDIDRVRRDPQLSQEIQELPIAGAVIMVFDTKNTPTNDVRVRQALAMAIDYEVLSRNVLRGAFAPARSFSPPELESHNPDTWLGTDVARARELLAEAGYPNGQGFPPFELAYWSQERESLIAQAIQAMWRQNLGIEIRLQPYEPAAMRDYRVSRATEPFQAYLALNWAGLNDPHQFHNNQLDPASNVRHSRYDNPDYVALIRAALSEPNLEKRREMYREAEALINRDVPILSLVYEARTWLVKPYVQNFAEVTTAIAEMVRVAAPPGLKIER